MDLKDDPKLINSYIEAHNRYNSWPEIRTGIRAIGILEMELYILGNRLFMIVEPPMTLNGKVQWQNWPPFRNRLNGKTSLQCFKNVRKVLLLHKNGK